MHPRQFWDEQGQDIAEYAIVFGMILVIVVGTIRLVGSNTNTVFSQLASLGAALANEMNNNE